MPASRVVPTHENDAAEPNAGDSVEALVAAADGVPARDSGEEVAPVRRSEDEDGGAAGGGGAPSGAPATTNTEEAPPRGSVSRRISIEGGPGHPQRRRRRSSLKDGIEQVIKMNRESRAAARGPNASDATYGWQEVLREALANKDMLLSTRAVESDGAQRACAASPPSPRLAAAVARSRGSFCCAQDSAGAPRDDGVLLAAKGGVEPQPSQPGDRAIRRCEERRSSGSSTGEPAAGNATRRLRAVFQNGLKHHRGQTDGRYTADGARKPSEDGPRVPLGRRGTTRRTACAR